MIWAFQILRISSFYFRPPAFISDPTMLRKYSSFKYWARFRSNEDGAISMIAVAVIFIALGMGAVVVDAGAFLLARRELQNATDAAAFAAVQKFSANSAAAYQQAARDVITENGYDGAVMKSATLGVYTADESLTPAARFSSAGASTSNGNAIRVETEATAPVYFARVFGFGSTSTIKAVATAAQLSSVSFGAGTRLASIDSSNSAVLNSVLGQMLGTTLDLSAVDYNALLNTRLDALTLMQALATQANVQGVSYEDLLNASLTPKQVLTAAMTAIQNSPSKVSGSAANSVTALQQVTNAISSGSAVQIKRIVDAPDLYDRMLGSIKVSDGIETAVNLLDLLSASAKIVGANKLIDLGTSVSVPIVNTSVRTRLAIGEPMKQIIMGKKGTSIQTAQTRLGLEITLLSLSIPLLSTSVSLPVYVEAASGTATVASIPCNRNGTMATIDATTGVTSARVGTVSNASLANFSSSVTPGAASIASIGVSVPLVGTVNVATVQANGTASIAGSSSTLSYSQTDMNNRTVKSVSSSGSLLSNLGSNLTLTITVLNSGLLSPILNTLTSSLSTLTSRLLSALSVLDAPLNVVLSTLGIQLGTIDVVTTGASCGVPAIVS